MSTGYGLEVYALTLDAILTFSLTSTEIHFPSGGVRCEGDENAGKVDTLRYPDD